LIAPRQYVSAEIVAHEIRRAHAAQLFRLTVPAFDKSVAPAPAHDHLRLDAEKGITRQTLAALDRFEQKRIRRIMRQTQEGAHGRLQIRQHAAHDGHDVPSRRLACKILKCRGLKLKHIQKG
jgi:hypothetical protein